MLKQLDKILSSAGKNTKMQFEDMNARDMHRPYKKLLGWKNALGVFTARSLAVGIVEHFYKLKRICLSFDLFHFLMFVFKRNDWRYIQRIDEMERIIRFLLEELTKATWLSPFPRFGVKVRSACGSSLFKDLHFSFVHLVGFVHCRLVG